MLVRITLLLLALVPCSLATAQTLLGQEHWPDGTLRCTRYAEGGRIHFITYHENGRVHEQGGFYDGYRDGVWRQFSDTGVLLAQALFHLGERRGTWEFRGPNNALMGRLGHTAGDLSTGKLYDERGALVAMRSY
jgi:antitoxin component YwqK of YwqJK toxin-antitoxin module